MGAFEDYPPSSRARRPRTPPREIMSFFLNRAMTMQGIIIQIEQSEMERPPLTHPGLLKVLPFEIPRKKGYFFSL